MSTFGFRRVGLRELVGPAPEPLAQGHRLLGPRGVVADDVRTALGPVRRAVGLIGRTQIEERTALLIAPCSQVHTIGMRFAIDAVFCDRDLNVVATRTLDPGKVARSVPGATCCFELAAGTAAREGIEPGVRLRLARGS